MVLALIHIGSNGESPGLGSAIRRGFCCSAFLRSFVLEAFVPCRKNGTIAIYLLLVFGMVTHSSFGQCNTEGIYLLLEP